MKRPAALSILTLLPLALAGGAPPPVSVVLAAPTLAAPVREVTLAAAPDGTLHLGAVMDSGRFNSGRGTFTGRVVRVWRASGQGWVPLGDVLNYRQPRPASNLNLVLDERGAPAIVWNENYGDNDVVELRAWREQEGWTDWGARYLGDDLPYAARTRAVAAWSGEIVLAWGEYLRKPDGSQLTVRRWNAEQKSWVRGPAFNDIRAFSRTPALALTRTGAPVVAWLQGEVTGSRVLAARWTGQAWQPLGGPLNRAPAYVASTRLALDGQDRPTAAWLEQVGGQDTLLAARWTGQGWQPLGGPVSRLYASSPSLAVAPDGQAVLAWIEERLSDGLGQMRAARWDGRAWVTWPVLNRDPRRDARSASVAVDAKGHITAAWREDVAGKYAVQLRRLQ
ncbi:hypothetical protein K7W42_14215 [Deinococcus sp. HMF7604]|uniref:hypothetical protein n=1 Tax=Deinococcus betulae TaxID=2873312 RepID=UPI001CCB42B6|nr:hypothetical protein [Deinococcus betulae]MBZ9752012.1 hypothetical protein [Deinococcus betulae]